MKTFRQLSEQLDVSSEHGPNAGRFASGGPKKVITTQPQATPRREVDENAPEAGDDITNQPSPTLVRKNGKIKSADALPDAEMGGTMSRYMPEARMSAAVKLQRAFQREQEKSAASRKRAEELMRPKQEPVKPVKEAKDEEEYGYEGDMALNQLATLTRCAEMIKDMLKPDTDMPEWVQTKITLATDYIQTAADYMYSEMKEEVKKPTGDLKDACWTGYTAVGMKMKNGKKVPNCVPVKEDAEQLEEGRPSQRHPLEGHEYHKKSNEALVHIAKDAHAAAEAMKSHNTTAENKYRDQANDSATVRYFRQKNGMPDWYKKKYGHVKEEAMNIDEKITLVHGVAPAGHTNKVTTTSNKKPVGPGVTSGTIYTNKPKPTVNEVKDEPPFDGPYKKTPTVTTDKSGAKHGPMSRARDLARDAMKKVSSGLPKKKLTESRKAEIVKQASKDAKKKTKEKDKEIATDKFQAQPTLDSQVIKTD